MQNKNCKLGNKIENFEAKVGYGCFLYKKTHLRLLMVQTETNSMVGKIGLFHS